MDLGPNLMPHPRFPRGIAEQRRIEQGNHRSFYSPGASIGIARRDRSQYLRRLGQKLISHIRCLARRHRCNLLKYGLRQADADLHPLIFIDASEGSFDLATEVQCDAIGSLCFVEIVTNDESLIDEPELAIETGSDQHLIEPTR